MHPYASSGHRDAVGHKDAPPTIRSMNSLRSGIVDMDERYSLLSYTQDDMASYSDADLDILLTRVETDRINWLTGNGYSVRKGKMGLVLIYVTHLWLI